MKNLAKKFITRVIRCKTLLQIQCLRNYKTHTSPEGPGSNSVPSDKFCSKRNLLHLYLTLVFVMAIPWAASVMKKLGRHKTRPVPATESDLSENPGAIHQPSTARNPDASTNLDTIHRLLKPQIILKICQHLSKVGRASLALSSRQLLSSLGRDVLRLSASDKFLLLQRLERDGDLIRMVLCPECRYFHLPRFNPGQEPRGPERDRACLTDETERMIAFRPLLPLRFDMVAAILRSHRHKNDIYSPQLICFDKEYTTRLLKSKSRYVQEL